MENLGLVLMVLIIGFIGIPVMRNAILVGRMNKSKLCKNCGCVAEPVLPSFPQGDIGEIRRKCVSCGTEQHQLVAL